MIVVGGVTRLTDSGLSMVDWQPIMGALPPMTHADWEDAFDAYKQYPEYQKVNRNMDLDGFKRIFYWEYGHRVLGRLIGVIFFIPFVYLWLTRRIEKKLVPKLLIALALGGLQGLMGWYMVMSGLVDMPQVSHYRLAAHLLLALAILCYLLWIILDLIEPSVNAGAPMWFRNLVLAVLCLTVLQITYGAFVSGLHAGYGFNTFPLMNGQWIADAVGLMDPWWINLFESHATVQFTHRWLGTLLLLSVLALWVISWKIRLPRPLMFACHVLCGIVCLQFILGVLTLIYVIPLMLASAHQSVACFLLVSIVFLLHRLHSAG